MCRAPNVYESAVGIVDVPRTLVLSSLLSDALMSFLRSLDGAVK